MSNGENLTLHRLLNRRDATALIQTMEASVADLALALVRNDGTVFVSTANWTRTQIDAKQILHSLDAGQVTQVDHCRLYPLAAGTHLLGAMVVFDQMPARSQSLERALHHSLNIMLTEALEKRDVATEALERYREINLMYRVSESMGTVLEVEKIPGLVLDEGKRTIRAEAGAIFLASPHDAASWNVHAGFCPDEGERAFSNLAPNALGQVWQSDRPAIVTDYPDEIGYSSLLYAPLKTQEHVLGSIVLGRARGQAIFTASDEKLLMALARQAAIAVENARLHQAVLVKERLEHELQLARDVQASLIPSQTPKIPGWEFAAYWNPAREVAGDFYDFIANVGAPGLQHGIVIADVSDKGMHAALFMALTRSVLRAATTAGQSPAASVTQSNRLLCADSTGGMFVTLFYAQLDPAKNEMTYVNAGHNPPFLFRAKDRAIEQLDRTGIMLGFDEQAHFEQHIAQFHPGDFIVFYTDGVTEAFNPADEQFGEERLLQLLRADAAQSPDEILQTLRRALIDFVGDRPQSDDITIVIAKCVDSAR